MTREQRILNLTPTVERCARRESWRNPDDVIGWAWITAIQVVDKYPDLPENELRGVVAVAIRRREIDRRRQMWSIGDHEHTRWMREVPIEPLMKFRSDASALEMSRVENRIMVDQIRALLPPIERGPHATRAAARERAWKIMWATLAEEKTDAEIGPQLGLTPSRVGRIARETIVRLRAAI